METSIEYLSNEPFATLISDELKWKKRMYQLKQTHPDQVTILQDKGKGENLIATFPKEWVKLRRPRQMNLTDEQRAQLSERMKSTMTKRATSPSADA